MSKLLDARNKALDDINAGKTVKKIRDQESELESLRAQLAECQATNGKLREALECKHDAVESLMSWCVKNVDKWDFPQYDYLSYANERMAQSIALPNDATALNELIAERTKELEKEFNGASNLLDATQRQVEELEQQNAELTAQRDAVMEDAERLDFIEANPGLHLRKHKKHWEFVGFTNYEYPVFSSAREAIDAAIANCKDQK